MGGEGYMKQNLNGGLPLLPGIGTEPGAALPARSARPLRSPAAAPLPVPVPVRRVMVTGVGLRFPERVDFGTWEQVGRKLARIANCSAWCLGDWLVYGSYKYSERYRQVLAAVELDYQTLRNYAWVARRFELARRRDRLSFQHHAEVASAPVEDQDRWLDLAEADGWSRNELRRRVRSSRGESPEPARPTGSAAVLVLPWLNVPAERVMQWRDAARQLNRDFEEWIVAALDHSATEALWSGTPTVTDEA
jgi:hypothetical protein